MKKEIFTFALLVVFQLNSWSQTEEKISFDYNATELSTVLEDLDNRYDLTFSYANQPELLAVNISAKGEELILEEGLNKIFDEQPVKYKILAGQVVLRYEQAVSKIGAVAPSQETVPSTEVVAEARLEQKERPAKPAVESRAPVADVSPIQSHRPRLFSLKYHVDIDEDHDDGHTHFLCNNDGPGGFEVYTSDIFRFHFSFKSGQKNFYSLVNFSSDRVWPWRYKKSDPQWAFGIGAGYRGEILRVPFRTELILNHINEDKFISTRLNELLQLRTVLGLPFLGTEITFGPTFNLHVSGVLNEDTNQIGSKLLPGWEQSELSDDKGIYYWIGGTIGILF